MIRAVLGGSFDPFHNGHLALVETILARDLADRILVIPAHHSPHKEFPVVAGHHRLHMAELALAHIEAAEVLTLEVDRGGISYTVDTLRELTSRWPADDLRLVLGADNLTSFHNWREPEAVLALAPPIVFGRENWTGILPTEWTTRAQTVVEFSVPVSATEVRAALESGQWPRKMVPALVLEYIATHRLYGAWGSNGGDCLE